MSTSMRASPPCVPADEAQHETTSSDPAFEATPVGAASCLNQLHGLTTGLDSCHRHDDSPGLQRDNFSRFRQGFADTILERMRSRADTSLVTEDVQPDENHEKLRKSLHHYFSSQEITSIVLIALRFSHCLLLMNAVPSQMAVLDKTDEMMIRSTRLAKKRVRVAQLLIAGLIGLLLGCLGNFFVTTSCHFGSTTIQVGQNGDTFQLHFGLWKYSPVDSALNGYSYCYPYSAAQHRAPIFSRLANLFALLLGNYSQGCVWCYLILGVWRPALWRAAVYTAILAGLLQLSTLLFFAEKVCRTNHCGMGPASAVAILTSIVWVVLAWEVHYNTPRDKESIANLEMGDLQRASAEYITRFQPEPDPGYEPPELASVRNASLD